MLHLHRAERADALIAPLAAVLARPLDDPFAPDVVAVPTRGVERWVAQRLSHHVGAPPGTQAGVCANVAFDAPARLVARVLSQTLGLDPDDDPWAVDRLTWPVLQVIDECAGEPWCSPLGRYLGLTGAIPGDDELRQGRRLVAARHLARLFAAYHTQRPAVVLAWAAGRDDDGAGAPVPEDLAWQPGLWRRVRERLAVPSPAERLGEVLCRLAEQPGLVDLPARLSVFGPTRLPEDQLQVLHALSRHRAVHLWLVHPSPALWAAVADRPVPPLRRREQGVVADHPLLASMARDVVELQTRLAALGPAACDEHHAAAPPARSLLGALQARLRADAPGTPPEPFDPSDRSVEVHACHGRARQVEVLREVLVGLFADDPTLEPRDVLVMCPDIEAVAPLVAATFGLAETAGPAAPVHPGQTLRVRLADRSLRQTNPQLALIAALLELADGRVTASEVLDLVASPPIRYRFRFDDDELDRVREWAVAAGAHWGEDARRRARFGLGAVRQGTWDAVLDRLLLGAAMAEEDQRFVDSALPLDDVDSTDIDLAGRFAEFVDRLAHVLSRLDGRHGVRHWIDALDDALDLLAGAPPTAAWQGVQARQVLTDVRQAADALPDDVDDHGGLRLPDVRAMLADQLRGRPTRAGFRTGALTVCSLEPMRAVPHRVICLLGLDDNTFPRSGSPDGDDVLLRDPCRGERDRRSEDRQLFLDAVTAAGDHLVVLYSGADERTGAIRPPAVPVGELLDALDRAGAAPDGRPVREHIVVRHPLQPIDERNFTPAALRRRPVFSFDAVAHRAAVAGRAERRNAPPFLVRPLPAGPRPDVVELDDLVALLEHPVKWFLRTRLQVSLPGEVDDVSDRLPLELDPLTQWHIGDRLLSARLTGVARDRAVNAEWRRGEAPPRWLGRAALEAVAERVVPVASTVADLLVGESEVVDLTADLPSTTTVTGSVPGVHGDVVVRAVYSKLGAKHRLRAWIQVLALVTAYPERSWQAVTVGRAAGSRSNAAVATVRAPHPAVAAQRLEDLVRLRERALREPLPVPPATAQAYANSRMGGDSEEQALDAARKAWRDSFEDRDRHHQLCWGEGAALEAVLGTPDATEQSWFDDRTRLGLLARRVWEPLLQHEEIRTV